MEDSNLLCPFDDDLFGFNPYGLASLLEPVGWGKVVAMAAPKPASYANNGPKTAAIAASLLASIPDARRWGRQMPHGRWTSFTEGEPKGRFAVRLKKSPETPYIVEPLAEAMSEADVRKALFGRTLAVGSSDAPSDAVFEHGERHGLISCLRIDVDQDDAWLHERAEPIIAELRDARRVAEAMGLPFAAYKTGGRGFQALLSLPSPLEPAAASFLSRGVLMALRGRRRQNGASVDKDGFQGLLRLPGARHAYGNTGLFIDLDRERLFGVADQAWMVASGLSPKKGEELHSLDADEALEAQRRLLPTLRSALGSALCVCTERDVPRILRAEPANPLCLMVARAFGAAGADLREAMRWRPRERFSGERPDSIYHCDRAWAEGVWREEIVPGGYWRWVHMGGERGMLAAVVLFGPERALGELLEKAERHPAVSSTDAREREATTKGLWRSFALKHFVPRSGRSVPRLTFSRPDARSEALARRVAGEAKARSVVESSTARWREDALAAVVAIVVQAMRDGDWERLEFPISVREVAREIRSAYPSQAVSHVGVNAYLRLVTRDDESGHAPLVERLVRVQMARHKGEASLFLPAGWLAEELLTEAEARKGEDGGPPQ